MSINERQNNEINLKRLAAQRQLYSNAKILMKIQFALSGVSLIVFAVIGNIISKEYAVYVTVLSILCVSIDELFLTKKIDSLRFAAGTIQEDFDCDVLQIPINHIKNSHGSMLEIIQENSKKYLSKHKSYDALLNWYPGIDTVDLKFGRIICQNTNCWWNQKLREKYSDFLTLIAVVIFIILLLISLFNGITLNGFIMAVISPILPGGVLVYKINRDNKRSIQNLNYMKNKLDEIINKLRSNYHYTDKELLYDIRLLQDMIYENRITSPLVPDFFYSISRNKYEEITKESTEDLIKLFEEIKGSTSY